MRTGMVDSLNTGIGWPESCHVRAIENSDIHRGLREVGFTEGHGSPVQTSLDAVFEYAHFGAHVRS